MSKFQIYFKKSGNDATSMQKKKNAIMKKLVTVFVSTIATDKSTGFCS